LILNEDVVLQKHKMICAWKEVMYSLGHVC
jgi:hypothetical protein